MVKYRHLIRIVEGSLDTGQFKDVATLKYESSLPSAPTIGLVVELSDLVEFEIAEVRYLSSEQIYKTFSHIDLLELEDRRNDYIDRAYEAARFVKYGFTVSNCDDITITAEKINMKAAQVKE